MKKKDMVMYGFIVLALIQLAVPASMIAEREITLRYGTEYRFRTAPVDPYDAFRGRYVSLEVEQNAVSVQDDPMPLRGQVLYVTLSEDQSGFARLESIERHRPEHNDYLKVHALHVSGNNVYVRLPFDRYYMNEKAAPAAEAAYTRHSSTKKSDAYVSVRVRSGSAVLENLYISGQPIELFLESHRSGS